MKSIYNKAIVAASMLMACSGAMAQELNSAYYTEDYNFRHEMNPAYGNEQNYVSIPGTRKHQCRTARKLRLSGCCAA